ncbi:MAG: DapH/DapD/GlmU-related protein [Jatrophihabitans sp.]|uniref:acyltransferase n=1 Tax=Jatrophihabitans sp. TaxID=1932789 RepID=UPI00391273BC
MPEVVVGSDLHADPTACIGYRPSRGESGDLTLGPGAHIRSGSALYLGSHIGARLQTGHNVVIREGCVIGDDVSIWSNTVIDYGCHIGDGVKIHSNCYIAQYTEIEDGAFLAPGVTIANDLYPGQPVSARLMAGPNIGAGAQIGVNVTILPYVHIGERALIGAGAVVVLDIPADSVAFGNPAEVRGRVGDLTAIDDRVKAAASSMRRRHTSRAPAMSGREGDAS